VGLLIAGIVSSTLVVIAYPNEKEQGVYSRVASIKTRTSETMAGKSSNKVSIQEENKQ
jgi:hypothetical protein